MLSESCQKAIQNALADPNLGDELIDAVNAAEAMSPAADVPAVSTANATDLPSAEALANQLKSTVNSILANLKSAGLMS